MILYTNQRVRTLLTLQFLICNLTLLSSTFKYFETILNVPKKKSAKKDKITNSSLYIGSGSNTEGRNKLQL